MRNDLGGLGGPQTVPVATRSRRNGWKDPRLWIGVALVALSVVLGARWFAAADNTVAIWRTSEPLRVGMPVTVEEFEQTRVHFDTDQAAHYLLVSDGEPKGQVLREVGAGELVPKAALGPTPEPPLATVSLELPSARVPVDLAPGSRVNLWVLGGTETGTGGTGPGGGHAQDAASRRLAQDVLILQAPTSDTLGGAAATRQIVVGLPAGTPDSDLLALMEADAQGRVTVSGESQP